MTLGLNLTPLGFEPCKYWLTPTDPDTWAVQGIARELYDAMAAQHAIVKPVWDGEICKWLIDKMLVQAGVDVLYQATCVDGWTREQTVLGAVVGTRSGLMRIRADVSIDCSGDGELFSKVGAEYDIGREGDGRTQPMELAALLGGVGLDMVDPAAPGAWESAVQQRLTQALDAAARAGEFQPAYNWLLYPRVAYARTVPDQAWVRWVAHWADPTDPLQMSRAHVEARQQLFQIVHYMRAHVPGMQDVAVMQTSREVWPRESRRLRGVVQLHQDDITANRKRPDGIAVGTAFLAIRSATPGEHASEEGYSWSSPAALFDADIAYDIAYGCLVPAIVDGLLVAGRCLSATHLAQSSARMQITSMAMGQAAGLAAALAIELGVAPRDVPVAGLRAALLAAGARL